MGKQRKKNKPDTHDFRVRGGDRVQLDRWPTAVEPLYSSKQDYRDRLETQVKELSRLQTRLYADNRYALLVVFQAMDTGGKDGAIKHVMSGVNPQGCQVHSFKHPAAEELDHDFLWRTTRALPERGQIGIFNRSYYEEVLIVRVHPPLLQAEQLPDELLKGGGIWESRYQSIRDFEQHLTRNGTRILKFFLHISKEEQRKRFIRRLEDPEKVWKFSLQDVEERKYWSDYMRAYEACMSATSTKDAPWFVIPADDKGNARLLIANVIVETLKSLRLSFPEQTGARSKELQAVRKQLEE